MAANDQRLQWQGNIWSIKIPIIIIGNKMDKDELKETIGTQVIRDVLKLALKKHKQV